MPAVTGVGRQRAVHIVDAHILGRAAQGVDHQVAGALARLEVAVADLGHAVGVIHGAHRHAADGDDLVAQVAAGGGDHARGVVHRNVGEGGKGIVGLHHLALGVLIGTVIQQMAVIRGAFGVRNFFIEIILFGVADDVVGLTCCTTLRLHTAARPGVADVHGSRLVLPHPGLAQGHKLVAEQGVALFFGLARRHIRLGGGADAQEAVHHVTLAIAEVAVGHKVEIAHPGEGQRGQRAHVALVALEVLGDALVAHQEEAVAVDHHVGSLSGHGVVSGTHVDAHRAHVGTVADLGGVAPAHVGRAVGAAGEGGVDRGAEHGTGGFIAVGVHVGDVVAVDVQVVELLLRAHRADIEGLVHLTYPLTSVRCRWPRGP